MEYIVVVLNLVTYVLFILALVLTRNSERKQCDLNKIQEKTIEKFKQENDALRFENEELRITETHIRRLVYEANKTNPFTLARDIKKELDNSPKSF